MLQATAHPLLVVVFLRGGCDTLNLVMPLSGEDRAHYESARPTLKMPTSGETAALPLDRDMGLHPSAVGLGELYAAHKLAVILAAGMHVNSRSHFDCQAMLELGTPGNTLAASGWLARHFASAPNLPDEIMMPSISIGSNQSRALLGDRATITMASLSSFNLNVGPYRWRPAQRVALRHLYAGATALHDAGTQALNAIDIIEAADTGTYLPANGAVYPNNPFGRSMALIAQLRRLELGLRAATVDLGGWDTHNGQGDGAGGGFATNVATLSGGMGALLTDLGGSAAGAGLTMVVMTEFGRRLRQNADRGTDHGHGFQMLVAGEQVVGGVYGAWPGLANAQLYDGADLAVATDYRRVLAEILIRQLGNPNLGAVFPGYRGYYPLGFMRGSDLTPIYDGEPPSHFVSVPLVKK